MIHILPKPQQIKAGLGSFQVPSAWAGPMGALPAWIHNKHVALGRGPEAYILEIEPFGVTISSEAEPGNFYALQSLWQLFRAAKGDAIPCMHVEDWPNFSERGVSYDISRGRVPKLQSLFEIVDALAELKVNQLQLYTEHTFAFSGHPLIGKGCSPMTASQIRALDDYCFARHIELVPSLASFGHMSRVLQLPPYRHMAEDYAEGKYENPDIDRDFLKVLPSGWTLVPGREDSYQFIDSLYEEYLPLFRTKRFNLCCDETFDLGWGQSYGEVKKKGLTKVFAEHILKLRDLALKNGKTKVMIWGDVLHSHPGILELLPKDVIILDWDYNEASDFGKIKKFFDSGFEAWACPSTNSWGSLFPRIGFASQNIRAFAQVGSQGGAKGFLNTIWGDGGHFNLPEAEWPGLALGAELGWNASVGEDAFNKRFSEIFLDLKDEKFAEAMEILGDVATTRHHGDREWFWTSVFFAPPSAPIFSEKIRTAYISVGGRVIRQEREIDLGFAAEAAKSLNFVRSQFERNSISEDFRGLIPAWIFAADAMAHAVKKWSILTGPDGGTTENHEQLEKEMGELKSRFEELWRARSEESELEMTLKRYDAVIEGMRMLRARSVTVS